MYIDSADRLVADYGNGGFHVTNSTSNANHNANLL